jgi:hypothetical protein
MNITRDEFDKIKQEQYDAGYVNGEEIGYDAGYDEGYNVGASDKEEELTKDTKLEEEEKRMEQLRRSLENKYGR